MKQKYRPIRFHCEWGYIYNRKQQVVRVGLKIYIVEIALITLSLLVRTVFNDSTVEDLKNLIHFHRLTDFNRGD